MRHLIDVPIDFYPPNGGTFESAVAEFSVTWEGPDHETGHTGWTADARLVRVQIGLLEITRPMLAQMLTCPASIAADQEARDGGEEVAEIEAVVSDRLSEDGPGIWGFE